MVLFVLSLIAGMLDLLWPLAIKHILDGILPSALPIDQKTRALAIWGAGILAILIVKQAFDSTRAFRMAVLNVKVIFRLRQALFEALLKLGLSQLSELKAGGIISRLSNDVDAVSGLIQMALVSPGVAFIRVILTVGVLFYLSWQLALVALVAMPPLAVLSYLWLRTVRPIYRSTQQDRQEVDARVGETFGGIRVVRAFRRETREARDYAVGHHTVIRKFLRAQTREIALEGVWGILIPGASLMIVWYGGYLSLRGLVGVGDIFAFQIYAVLLLQPIWQIVSSISQTQKSLAAMQRVFEAMELPPDKPDAPDAADAPTAVESIRFEHVDFAYRDDAPVLVDFDLTVPGGVTVALVGPSGAGKTTVTDLVARFHDPTAGRIVINGMDLRQLRLGSYRRRLAIVPQEVFLFDGTIERNIAYGRRGATRAQVIDAARRANAHDFIDAMPDGYDTFVGERGFKLSGGQRQRLSIARALLADAPILILDEATSNLDSESERLIQRSLTELFRGRTTFVIAHRLSTVVHADLIVVLEAGRIVERGTHAELMTLGGLYHAMVHRQRLELAEPLAGEAR